MKLRPYTDHEYETLPHIVMTSDKDWDPSITDNDADTDDIWHACVETNDELDPGESLLFDVDGNYYKTTLVHNTHI